MGNQKITTCDVCGMDLLEIGLCPACGHIQKILENKEDNRGYEDFYLPYGIDHAPYAVEKIHIPYGIKHAP